MGKLSQEQVYRVIDTQTGLFIYTGRSINPANREKQHARSSWWRPEFRFESYRVIERYELSDSEYGIYAAVIEHMEICKNQTWQNQGGRNKMSPIRQHLGGPDALKERARIGGLKGWQNQPQEARDRGRFNAGQTNLKLGTMDRIRTPETCRKGGLAAAEVNIASGQLASLRTPAHQRAAGLKAGRQAVESGKVYIMSHVRNHVNRNKPNPRCVFCSEQNLIVAYA